jgi:hypothetical protein
MKSATRTAAGLIGLVVFAGAVSAGVFVAVGSQWAVYAAVGMVPLLLISGGVWIQQRVDSKGTDQTKYTRRRAREVGETFSDIWQTRQQLKQTYPTVIDNGLGLGIDSLQRDLQTAGINVDTETGAFSLGDVSDLETINSLSGRVDDTADELPAAFAKTVEDRLETIADSLDRLDTLVEDGGEAVRAINVTTTNAGAETTAAGESLEAARGQAIETIDTAAETIQSIARTTDDVEITTIEKEVETAREAASNHQMTNAVTALLRARDAIKTEGENTFRTNREQLQSLLQTVDEYDIEQYLPDSTPDVTQRKQAVAELDDAVDLSTLAMHRKKTRAQCTEIIDALMTKLNSMDEELATADIPNGFYTQPAAIETDYLKQVQESDNLRMFEQRWATAVDALTAAIDEVKPKVAVISGYDQVEPVIESALQSDGQITGDALPVRNHETQFLGLYYRSHPDQVTLNMDVPSLKRVGGTETYTVTVAARFEHGGPDRQIRIVLNGADYDDETTVETPLVGTATFNDVPFGEYTVTAVAAVDGFGSAETEISVSGDTDVSLSIPSITLRDRVCDGIAEEASAYLDDLASRFSTRFDEATYLSSEMSYQIDESYVPCLLVLWAERTDNTATENSDGTIIVYDSDRLQQELTNVLRYNLDESETISLDELRERFLSAPVPNNEIQSVVNTDIENGIISDGELQKNES